MSKPLIPPEDHTAADIAKAIIEGVNQATARTVRSHTKLFNMLWRTPGVSPQEILDAMGRKASMIFVSGGGNIDMLKAFAEASAKLPDSQIGSLEDVIPARDWIPPQIPQFLADGRVNLIGPNPHAPA